MDTRNQLESHSEQMEALRKDFAALWLDQEIQLRRLNFSARMIHHAQRSAWLVFVALWRKMSQS